MNWKTLAIILGLIVTAVPAWADGPVINQTNCQATWVAPQNNFDLSNLTDLASYGVYVAATPAALAAMTAPSSVIAAPELDPPVGKTGVWIGCRQLVAGQWYVQVDAADLSGNRSARTPVSPFVLRDDVSPQAPGTPTFGP